MADRTLGCRVCFDAQRPWDHVQGECRPSVCDYCGDPTCDGTGQTRAGSDQGWWAISGDDLLDLLRQAHAGADPDLLYAEHYANAEIEGPL